MRVACGRSCSCGLGDATATSAASAAGSLIGSITGIPGLGQVAGFVAGLFGPSPHFTPSGVPYDTQDKTIKSLILQVASLTNQLHVREGLPAISVPAWTWNSADDPLLAKWMGALLNDPTVASATTEDDVIADQAHGIMDEAVTAAQSLIQQLNQELAAPASTPIAPVVAATDPATLMPAPDYQSQNAVPATAPPASYDATQTAAAPAASALTLAGMNWPLIGGVAVGGLIFILIAKRL